jgi:hypothetical protein
MITIALKYFSFLNHFPERGLKLLKESRRGWELQVTSFLNHFPERGLKPFSRKSELSWLS